MRRSRPPACVILYLVLLAVLLLAFALLLPAIRASAQGGFVFVPTRPGVTPRK